MQGSTTQCENSPVLLTNSFFGVRGALQIVNYFKGKTGKHGHAKATITALDIFTGRKYEDAMPTSRNVKAPIGKSHPKTPPFIFGCFFDPGLSFLFAPSD